MSYKTRSILADNILAVLSISAFLISIVILAIVSNGILLRQIVYVESFPGDRQSDRLLTFLPSINLRGISEIQDIRTLNNTHGILDPEEALQAILSVDVVNFCHTPEWDRYLHDVNNLDHCLNTQISLTSYGPKLRLGLDPDQISQHINSITDILHDLPPSKHGFPNNMADLQTVDLYSLIMIQWAAIKQLESRISVLEN